MIKDPESKPPQKVISSKTEPIEIKSQERPTDDAPVEKPVIKVKSFAIISDEVDKSTAKKTPGTPSNPPDKSTLDPNKDYVSGAFLVLRTDAANADPPIWKIDGKSLLQKYIAFEKDGKVLYKCTAEYAGWSLPNRFDYYPALVTFKQQDKKENIVQLDKIKRDPEDPQ